MCNFRSNRVSNYNQQQKEMQKAFEMNPLECDDTMPITSAIVGEWRPVSSIGTENLLQKRGGSQFSDIVFMNANHKFQFNGTKMIQHQTIGNEAIFELESNINEWNKKTNGVKINTTIENNVLKTTHLWYTSDYITKIYDIEERFIKDGKLHIVNKIDEMRKNEKKRHFKIMECTRIYERVEVFNFGSNELNIDEEIIGNWKLLTIDGLEEDHLKMSYQDRNLWKNGRISFKIVNIFNEIHIKHYLTPSIYKYSYSAIGGSVDEYNGMTITTYFEDNSLITKEVDTKTNEEKSRTIRFVKNGKLFISHYQNDQSFIAIYQKV